MTRVQGQPGVHSEFQASLGYRVRLLTPLKKTCQNKTEIANQDKNFGSRVRVCTGKDLHPLLRFLRVLIRSCPQEDRGHVGCWLKLLRTKQAGSSSLGCHQCILLCVLDGVQGSLSGCGLGRNRLQGLGWAQDWAAAPAADAGHALLDANTPPFPRAQGDTPSPADKQEADLYE